jgi:hypothetical protein
MKRKVILAGCVPSLSPRRRAPPPPTSRLGSSATKASPATRAAPVATRAAVSRRDCSAMRANPATRAVPDRTQQAFAAGGWGRPPPAQAEQRPRREPSDSSLGPIRRCDPVSPLAASGCGRSAGATERADRRHRRWPSSK